MPEAIGGVFVWLLGLTVGSFLNVVIYRLPAGLSVSRPRRSFCPHCRTQLTWRDNIPVLSWMRLCGRCRTCAAPISPQYPLVEALTGLVFVQVYYLLAVNSAHAGFGEFGLPVDVPLVLAWLTLAAALVACSVMDLVAYIVDIRVTNFAMYAGLFLGAFWPHRDWRGDDAASAAGAAAFLVSGVMLWWTAWRQERDSAREADESTAARSTGAPAAEPGGATPASIVLPADPRAISPFQSAAIGVWILVWLALLLIGVTATDAAVVQKFTEPVLLAGFLMTFLLIVLVGALPRPADSEVHQTIEAESPTARREVLRELAWLLPAILIGAATYMVLIYVPGAAAGWERLARWELIVRTAPLGGAAHAMCGAMVAAGAGYFLRIAFTLALGREAFGTGDIFILAAAGAAIGGELAVLGLLLSVGVALAGWLLSLLFKRSTMLPFGPALSLGFLLALWLHRPARTWFDRRAAEVSEIWQLQPRLLLVLAGMLLVSAAAALFIARVVRRLIEGRDHRPAG